MKNRIRIWVNRFRFVWHAEMARSYIMWYHKGVICLNRTYDLIMLHMGKLIETADRLTGLGYRMSHETMESIEWWRLLYKEYR